MADEKIGAPNKGEAAGKPAAHVLGSHSSTARIAGEGEKMSDTAVNYEAVLKDLEGKRNELDTAIRAIRKMLGKGDAAAAAATESEPGGRQAEDGQIKPDSFFGMTAVDAAKKCLRIKKTPLGTTRLTSLLRTGGYVTGAKNFYSNLYTSMVRDPELVRIGKGTWGLAEWYPGRNPRKGKIEQVEENKEVAGEAKG